MHRVVSREQCIAEGLELLAGESEIGPAQGRVTLAGLFRDTSELFVQHLMQGFSQQLQCVGCAPGVDGLESLLPQFENHFMAIYRTDGNGNEVAAHGRFNRPKSCCR